MWGCVGGYGHLKYSGLQSIQTVRILTNWGYFCQQSQKILQHV